MSPQHRTVGFLAWTACGKDEGWNPQLILEEANRNARITREEWHEVEWQGERPDFPQMKAEWRKAIAQAQEIIGLLPPQEIGKAVLNFEGEIFRGDLETLRSGLQENSLQFHTGHIGGVWPQIKPSSTV